MLPLPNSRFTASRIRFQRTARRLFWPHPLAYFPIGLLRKRGNVFKHDVEVYMGGYPRCGNTFTKTAFLSANPGARVLTHQCIPTFILPLIRKGVPGLILIRKPLDAAVSWAIHQNLTSEDAKIRKRFSASPWGLRNNLTLEEALAYWNDYHETLLPVRSRLFITRFEDVTQDFGTVIAAFNEHWGTSYTPFDHTAENAAKCFQVTEEEHRLPGGKVLEMQVCRPSEERTAVKQLNLAQIDHTECLRAELARAEELYEKFVTRQPGVEPKVAARPVPAANPVPKHADAGAPAL